MSGRGGHLLVLGQLLMLCGLAVPLAGLFFALTASSGSDMQIIGLELMALTIGYLLFTAGRWVAAKDQES